MAINFEAANMAGYNNPKIEVFEATLAEDGTSLTQYPNKSIILNCLNRGSIPIIILRVGSTGDFFLLFFREWSTSETGTSIVFSTLGGPTGSMKIQITYPDKDEDPPLIGIE